MNATLDRNRTEFVNRISQIKKEIKNYEFLWAQARGDWDMYFEADPDLGNRAALDMEFYSKEIEKLREELERLEEMESQLHVEEQKIFETMPHGTVEELMACADAIREARKPYEQYQHMLDTCNEEIGHYETLCQKYIDKEFRDILSSARKRKEQILAEGISTKWKIVEDQHDGDCWFYDGEFVDIVGI